MALEVAGIARLFVANIRGKEITLADPNPSLLPEQVRNLYVDSYPELASATVHGPEITVDCVKYSFTAKLGTKG